MLGNRLKIARRRAGLSLRALADAMGGQVSAQAIGKYERGEMMPSSRILGELARTLDVSVDFLMTSEVVGFAGTEFRRKASTTAAERAVVEAEVIEHVERYLAVEDILELESSEWHRPRCADCLVGHVDEAEALADRLRSEWQLGTDPIPSMTALLEDHGIKVLMLDLPKNVSGMRCDVLRRDGRPAVPVIVINERFALERRRLTLAHELGHLMMDPGSPADHERAANRFAGAFLVAAGHLVGEIGARRRAVAHDEIMLLKHFYRVGAVAFLIRLRDLGIIDQSRLTIAFRTFARGWRANEPHEIEAEDRRGELEAPQRFRRLCLWALSEDLISPVRAAELLQRPLDELTLWLGGPDDADSSHRQ